MSHHTNQAFEATMEGYQRGFQVRHIATFDLATCSPSERVKDTLDSYPDFDQVPVNDQGRIVGVLERENNSRIDLVRDKMKHLDDSLLVSADEPLIDFIPFMSQAPFYRLVLEGAKINGIVTRSDLLKLPVRLLGFGLITHLELLMKELILNKFQTDEDWLALLSKSRRAKVFEKQDSYKQNRIDPPLVELTEFCDKRDIVKKKLKLGSAFGKDLKDIEALRNSLAHAGTFVNNELELRKFIDLIDVCDQRIDQLSGYLL